MNFCVALSLLKMEENKIFAMLCFIILRKVKTQLKRTQKDVCSVWGGAVTERTWQGGCDVPCWGFLLDDAPQLGRPVEVHNDQTKTLTDNNQRYLMQEIANTLKMSKSTKLLETMKTVSFICTEKKHTDFLANPIYKFKKHTRPNHVTFRNM